MKEKTYIGYVRVSSVDQNEARQLKTLEKFGKPMHRIFIDKCSGKNIDRPELKKMLDYVRDEDVLVVSEYARLTRSSADMLRLVDELQAKGVEIISLREQLDTTTPRMMKNRETMNKGKAQDITKLCNTVGSHLAKVSLNSTDPVLMVNGRYRRFTPREIARIQSFSE